MTRSCTNSPPDYFCVLEVSVHVNRRNMALSRKSDDPLSVVRDKGIRRNEEGAVALPCHGGESVHEVTRRSHFQRTGFRPGGRRAAGKGWVAIRSVGTAGVLFGRRGKQRWSLEVCLDEVSPPETRQVEVRCPEISPQELRVVKLRPAEVRAAKGRDAKLRVDKVRRAQSSLAQKEKPALVAAGLSSAGHSGPHHRPRWAKVSDSTTARPFSGDDKVEFWLSASAG